MDSPPSTFATALPAPLAARVRAAGLLLSVAALLAPLPLAQDGAVRQVIAGPHDIASGLLRLPEPGSILTRSRSALFVVELDSSGSARVEVPVGVSGPLALAALASSPPRVSVRFGNDGWNRLERAVADGLLTRQVGKVPYATGLSAERYDWVDASGGQWAVGLEGDPGSRAALLVADASPIRIAAHFTSHELYSGGNASISAFLYDARDAQVEPVALDVERALLHVETETARISLPLAAGPGGTFTAPIADLPIPEDDRAAVAQVDLAGWDSEGQPFARSVLLAWPRVARTASFGEGVREEARPGGSLLVSVAVEAGARDPRLHASTELWGAGADGNPVPIAWLSSIQRVRRGGVSFELGADLLSAAGAQPPLELRHVRIQDPDTHVPFDRIASIALASAPASGSRTPQKTALAKAPFELLPRSLMLVHGYCSGGVWPPADFSKPYEVFLDVDQNRTNDEFAQLMMATGAGLDSFGVVAHSQGGMAALHLLTYYESGLDHASGGRRIQSVATPYQGTPLAPLGDIVPGVGCGANFDLGPDGAALWLAGIPSAQRSEVHYYTVSQTSFSACNFLSGFLLDDPEDGVVEMVAGQLPGGNNEGHTLGWCHSTGMQQPAAYHDSARNQLMDAAASR